MKINHPKHWVACEPPSTKREEIKSILNPPSLSELGNQYHYTPTQKLNPHLNLGIDWESLNLPELVGAFTYRMLEFSDKEPYFSARENIKYVPIQSNQINSVFGDIELETRMRFERIGRDQRILLKLKNHNHPSINRRWHAVSEFDFSYQRKCHFEEWNMAHRWVSAQHRGLGIALNMIQVMEACLKARSAQYGQKQVMTAEVGQVDVLLSLLKKGFTPYSIVDLISIQLLFDASPQLTIISTPKNRDGEQKDWYIFDREVLERHQQDIAWEDDPWHPILNYIKMSYRIRLKKIID